MAGPVSSVTTLGSTKAFRTVNFVNASAQLANAKLEDLTKKSTIPGLFAQVIASSYLLSVENSHAIEKALQGFQAILSLTELCITISLWYIGDPECKQDSHLCTTLYISSLLRSGLILVFGAVAQAVQDPELTVPIPPAPPEANEEGNVHQHPNEDQQNPDPILAPLPAPLEPHSPRNIHRHSRHGFHRAPQHYPANQGGAGLREVSGSNSDSTDSDRSVYSAHDEPNAVVARPN